MRVCASLLSNHVTPVSDILLPTALSAAEHQLSLSALQAASQHVTGSPCSTVLHAVMAHTALLSPSKHLMCSSSTSPARSPAPSCHVMSPVHASPGTKRCLLPKQPCASSRSGDSSILTLSRQQQQQQVPAASHTPSSAADSRSLFQAPKRRASGQGSASSSSLPRQPATPAVSQPEPLAAQCPNSAAAQATPPPVPAAAAASAAHCGRAAAAPAAASAGASAPAAAGSLRRYDDCGVPPSPHTLPSPMTILEAPPGLMPSNAAQQHSADVSGLLEQRHSRHGRSRHLMSGLRLAAVYDVPLDPAYLEGFPDHTPSPGSGRLEVILGPMFAGKTTALLNRMKEVMHDGSNFIVVKSSKDKRYSDHHVVTHGGMTVPCVVADSLAEFKARLGQRWRKLQAIAIDEAQFFPDLVEFCCEAVDSEGKTVIAAGLSGDFMRRRFGQVLDLLPLADTITKLTSTCSVCDGQHGPALFSLRKVQGGPQEVVGGDEVYLATCRRCYLEATRETDG